MALETLKGVKEINNHKVITVCQDMGIPIPNYLGDDHIVIDHEINMIAFKIQNGPIKENGHNGCQVDEIIETAKLIIEGLNKKLPCRENAMVITKLDEALLWSNKRKADREKRGVEGQNKV